MARQETTNVFQDGLIMDLNPINTPKSVLTDCLNGTYITYNGNEFILQNDMGNYKLKNCQLNKNFIPVGVKSYADILYIVSYNPITKETEIGSYPSPKSLFTTSESPEINTEDNLNPFVFQDPDFSITYPDIINKQKKAIFIFGKENMNDYKLYPGDEYKLIEEKKDLDFIYQHLDFYVIDEDNKLYDLDDSEIYFSKEDEEFKKISWETPGWLAAQYNLYVPDKFNLNLKSLNVPEFLVTNLNKETQNKFSVSTDLSTQIIITNLLFQKQLLETSPIQCWNSDKLEFEHLYVRFLIQKNNGNFGIFQGITSNDQEISDIQEYNKNNNLYHCVDVNCKKHNYQENVITAYTNVKATWQFENLTNDYSSYDGQIDIIAYPIIKYKDKNDNIQTLEFTQFETNLHFSLNDLKDPTDIKIADSIYKWSVDQDSCTISFNINGPFVNSNNITGTYEIYRINLFNSDETKDSYSTWRNISISTNKNSTKYLNNDNIEQIISYENINNDLFYQTDSITPKLLMCNGNIPNLILYGQNTLNINWNKSDIYTLNEFKNEYKDPTTNEIVIDKNYNGSSLSKKEIAFSKEGGLYIFRINLFENESLISTKDLLLIPSEVFNSWFGTIDNYDNIYLNQWVENIYKIWNINNYELLSIDPIYNTYGSISIYKNQKKSDVYFDFSAEDFSNYIGTTPYITTIKPNTQFYVQLNWQDFIKGFNIKQNNNIKIFNENLWNSIYNTNYQIGEWSCTENKINDDESIELKIKDKEWKQLHLSFQVNEKQTPVFENKITFFPKQSYENLDKITLQLSCYDLLNGGPDRVAVTCNGETLTAFQNETIWPDNKVFSLCNTLLKNNKKVGTVVLEGMDELADNVIYTAVAPTNNSNWDVPSNLLIDQYILRGNDCKTTQDGNYYLLFRSTNNVESEEKGTVLVHINRDNSSIKIINMLPYITLNKYSDVEKTIYYQNVINNLDLSDNYTTTLNNININYMLNCLKVDDIVYYFNNNLYNIKIPNISSKLLNKTINNLNLNKTFNNSINSITLTINLINNVPYNSLFLNGNEGIRLYNNNVNNEYIKYYDTINRNLYIDYDSMEPDTYDKDLGESLLNKFGSIDGASLNKDNIGWICTNADRYMWAHNQEKNKSNGNWQVVSNNCGCICLFRYDEF